MPVVPRARCGREASPITSSRPTTTTLRPLHYIDPAERDRDVIRVGALGDLHEQLGVQEFTEQKPVLTAEQLGRSRFEPLAEGFGRDRFLASEDVLRDAID